MLAFKKLDVYRAAIQFFAVACRVRRGVAAGNRELTDQLLRASMSIVLNIAEGAGKTSERDRQVYYATARGSAMESGAILDVARELEEIELGLAQQGDDLLERIVGMLTRMAGVSAHSSTSKSTSRSTST